MHHRLTHKEKEFTGVHRLVEKSQAKLPGLGLVLENPVMRGSFCWENQRSFLPSYSEYRV